APVASLAASACGHLLGGPAACGPDTLEASLETLAAGCGDIAVEAFPPPLEGRYRETDDEAAPTVWRNMDRRIEQRWTMSSYSALARFALERAGDAAPGADSGLPALPDEARLE